MLRSPRTLLAAIALVVTLGGGMTAEAQEGFAGGVRGHFISSSEGELGGALSADVGYAFDVLRLGGFLGVGAVPSEEDTRNRIFMPLAASIGIELLGEVVGFSAYLRGGLWGGATQEVKLTVGGFVGGAAYLEFALGRGVAITAGLDVWGVLGDGETVLFAPSLGLSWMPPMDEEPAP
ncbi:MAG: hypothetical protein AB7S26_35335 [Sandaracinaceae bacterium]